MTTSARLSPQRYLDLLDGDSRRATAILAGLPITDRVPTCPEWSVGDLLYHLGQVHHFWATIVATDAQSQEETSTIEPLDTPEDQDALVEAAIAARGRLLDALAGADDDHRVWTWAARDQSVGFVRRRQAHEACIHRLDAELAAAPDGSDRTPFDPMLAADGVDEVLRLVAQTLPPGAEVETEQERIIRVVASDTGDTWLVTMTRVVVTEDGRPKAHQGIAVADTDPADGTVRPAAIIAGTAEDLYCTLWGRPALREPHRTGDQRLLEEFVSAVHAGLGGR